MVGNDKPVAHPTTTDDRKGGQTKRRLPTLQLLPDGEYTSIELAGTTPRLAKEGPGMVRRKMS
ncbi:MAG: hypothetical protein BWK78_09850 [Thiotrichaceae bacterium IS1]|nr:MAG: hypothetical protein BWK78_09850 [Thiotrichaceae bacterium IS1]